MNCMFMNCFLPLEHEGQYTGDIQEWQMLNVVDVSYRLFAGKAFNRKNGFCWTWYYEK